MSTEIVADKYSSAILELAREQDILITMEQDLSYVDSVIHDQSELREFLNNPILTADAKITLMGKIFGRAVNKTALHFIYVMIKRSRYRYIQAAIRDFIKKSRTARGIVEASVIVTGPLSDGLRASVTEKLQAMTGKEVILDVHEDPDIMGGIIIQIGDQRIDGSVARRLAELEKSLLRTDSIR